MEWQNSRIFFKPTWKPFDVTDLALAWFRSYMFAMGKHRAVIAAPAQGVLQGSVLGPLLSIIYVLPLSHII